MSRRPHPLIINIMLIAISAIITWGAFPSLAANSDEACSPNAEVPALIGVWESREIKGGLGLIMEFREDGGWVDPIGTIVDSRAKTPPPFVGIQTIPFNDGIVAYQNITADGFSQYRMPYAKPWGCYKVVGRKLRLSPAESPPEEVGYTLTETTLELVNKEGTKQVLFRVEPAWYRPPNEKELEIIAKSFDDDPLFQIIQTIPELLSPAAGATLDNGCNSAQDDMVWDFDWSDVPNAAKFHLIVRKKDAVSPVIDVITNESFYHGVSSGGYVFDRNRYEWEWKVQAEVDGRFGAFSKVRKFDIEPINSDCR